MESVAIPIETKVRELYGKMWLGLNLVKDGYRVIIGPSEEILQTLDVTRPDVYITKDPGDSNIEFFDKLRASGVKVCALDTEGGIYDSADRYVHNKKMFLNHIDAFFAWGEKPAAAFHSQYDNIDNVFVTGNPRFDLLHPELRFIYEEEAKPLIERFGQYIIYNMNFALVNPYSRHPIDKIIDIYGEIEDEKKNYLRRTFHLFIESIYYIRECYPDLNIIIRPHPSENNTIYEELYRDCDNVYVEDYGDVRAWIAGAEAVIHHDCTTGIESALMGIPVISYRPIRHDMYDMKLPPLVSEAATDREALAECVSKANSGENMYELTSQQTHALKEYFDNVDELSAEKICGIINSFEYGGPKDFNAFAPSPAGGLERRIKSSGFSNQATALFDTVKQLSGDRGRRGDRLYRKQKFPGFTYDEANQLIDQFDTILNLDSVTIEKVAFTNDTFFINK